MKLVNSNTDFLKILQSKYGSLDPNNVQTRRRQYYSFVAYPTAGSSSLTFFGQSLGQTNRQITNIQQAGRLDWPFLVKSIRCTWYCNTYSANSWDGTDATTIYSEIVNGIAQAGVLQFTIGSMLWLQLPQPLLYAPHAAGRIVVKSAGTVAANKSRMPWAWLSKRWNKPYVLDPEVFIEEDQNFKITIDYPTGALAATSTTAIANNTSLYLGVYLDGIEVRPVQ